MTRIGTKSKIDKKDLHVLSITSGKGGVGKTLTTVNLATAAANLGRKVLLLDGDLGLANVDVVLGLSARYNINDVIEGDVCLKDIILEGPLGIKIIPSGSGITRLTQLSYVQRLHLLDEIRGLNADYDTLIIDTGAGIADTVMHLNGLADENIVITTPEPHAMTDAYAMIKLLHERFVEKDIKLVVNMARTQVEAEKVWQRIADVARKFLNRDIEYLGFVPMDPQVQKLVSMRKAASANSSHTLSGQAWNQMAQKLFDCGYFVSRREQDAVWRELIWVNQEQVGSRL